MRSSTPFARASDAAAAAEEGQRALRKRQAGTWSVRMGLHSGERQLTQEGYVGLNVHRAARICAAAHGGQILLSERTRPLLAPGVHEHNLRPLGSHRLRDVAEPERLFQLGEGDFPPLRTLNQTNLPLPATPLVGRDKEVADVVQLLRDRDARLVTITGRGGEEGFESSRRKGAAMTVDEAIEYALSSLH